MEGVFGLDSTVGEAAGLSKTGNIQDKNAIKRASDLFFINNPWLILIVVFLSYITLFFFTKHALQRITFNRFNPYR